MFTSAMFACVALQATLPDFKVTKEFLNDGRITQGQYGQFIEYLANLVPGMWAEKLCDGSFEGLSSYAVEFIRTTDDKEHPWLPWGQVDKASFDSDPWTFVSGEQSKRIDAPGPAPSAVGIYQGGIAVQKEVACDFSCYMRQNGLMGAVSVRLVDQGSVLAETAFRPGTEWSKVKGRLEAKATCNDAQIVVSYTGPGTLWLDNASLMPVDNVGGWRKDVVEALKALKPGVIRNGGSAVDSKGLGPFEWETTVGDPDHRTPFRAWGGLQPMGAGLAEIVDLCRAVGAEPLLCVRFRDKTPEDATKEVQYFNGSVDTPMGALRARNGHPEPYRMKYWQVGNEQWGDDYEKRLPAFCKAMKDMDPTIKLFSSMPTPEILSRSGQYLDYVCPHQYDCANIGGEEQELKDVTAMIRQYAPGRPIKIAVTEWNTTAGEWGPGRASLWTLENALHVAQYQNLLHRYCETVEIANRSNLTNSFCSGIIQTDNCRLFKTPAYYTQWLYANLGGDRPLRVEGGGPGLDVSATLETKSGSAVVFVVNLGLQDVKTTLDVSSFGTTNGQATLWTLSDTRHAGQPGVFNSFEDPERVSPTKSTVMTQAGRVEHTFPALSLTVVKVG